jgi:uncharacterized protein (TIGR00299 family) protein
VRGLSVALSPARVASIGATRFEVSIRGRHPQRTHEDIDAMIAGSKLSREVKRLARAIFLRLAEAEANVHRVPVGKVHFHEVGAADAIADIVAAAAGFAHLSAHVACSPLPMGRGFVDCQHGRLPLPAPAVVNCLAGVPTVDAGLEAELVTPTGAAILATVAEEFVSWPAIVPERVGWGAGTRTLPDRPNALRVVLGSRAPRAGVASQGSHAVLEANVDDMTGELVGHALAVLLEAGALDAWAAPVTMKKGRPGLVISVLARAGDADRLSELVLRETTSIGVRVQPVTRHERPRTVRKVRTRFGEIPVKVSSGPYGDPIMKPEFDACAQAAKKAKVPVRVVLAEALRVATDEGRGRT